MTQTDRFSVSIDTELLAAFDGYILAKRYGNRSEAIRDLIRDALLSGHAADDDARVSGVLSFLWDRRVEVDTLRLRNYLIESHQVETNMLLRSLDKQFDHVVLELAGCMGKVRALSDRLRALKSVTHVHLTTLAIDTVD